MAMRANEGQTVQRIVQRPGDCCAAPGSERNNGLPSKQARSRSWSSTPLRREAAEACARFARLPAARRYFRRACPAKRPRRRRGSCPRPGRPCPDTRAQPARTSCGVPRAPRSRGATLPIKATRWPMSALHVGDISRVREVEDIKTGFGQTPLQLRAGCVVVINLHQAVKLGEDALQVGSDNVLVMLERNHADNIIEEHDAFRFVEQYPVGHAASG